MSESLDLNLSVICGALASDPEMSTFDSGSQVARLLVTVRAEEPRRVDVIPVTLRDPDSEILEMRAGDRVWITGALQRRFYESSGRRSRIELVADHVVLARKLEETK